MSEPKTERVAIVLTKGFVPEKTQREIADALGKNTDFIDERTMEPPDAGGMQRIQAAAYGLRAGQFDRVVVLGGMPDDKNTPVEQGHAERLKWHAGNRADKIEVLPRDKESLETIGDLRQALEKLKGSDVTIISNERHLFPRGLLLLAALRRSDIKLRSAESLLKELSKGLENDYGKIPVNSEYSGLKVWSYELIASAITTLDLVSGEKQWGTNLIKKIASRTRK